MFWRERLYAREIPVLIKLGVGNNQALLERLAVDRNAVYVISGNDITIILAVLCEFHA